jgi:uncharacterized repeat protein (TIGR03803 family)
MPKLLPLSIVLLAASTALSAQTYTVLHNFGSQAGDPWNSERPLTIAQSRGGAMLTTSLDDPHYELGKAFRIWPGGGLQVLHQFDGQDGGDPYSGLILATDGRFYGTTATSGKFGYGTIFKMSQDGSLTTLHDFTGGPDGGGPRPAPIQSVEGDFYGNTQYGSVYRITKYGDFTLLHTLTSSDGMSPQGPLVQGTDFYFYGTAQWGGQYGYGTIFRVSSSGDFKVLVNFDGTNGSYPNAGLIQANDGNSYGVTANGGPSDAGVLFRMSADGTLTVLHNFTGGNDGSMPMGGLVQASDGNLYGTNTFGGKNGDGVLFRATLAGDVVTLHDFAPATGTFAQSALLQHTTGKLYGIANWDGKFGDGVFFSLDAGLPPFVTYLPTYGRPGTLVQILGQGFTTGSQVFFNGTPAASPVVVYPTYLRVIVPSGATTGPITVTTATGTLTSNKVFIVHP